MTLANLIKTYLRETELQQSPATLRNYKQRLGAFQTFVENQSIKKIDRFAVMEWRKSLLETGLANSTIRQYLTELKTFYAWCIAEGREKKNPCDGVKLPKPDTVEKEYLTSEECKELLSASNPPPELAGDRDYFRNWCMLSLTLTSGIRRESLVQLKVQDINFATGQATLNKAKGGKTYDVPAFDTVLKYIKQYIEAERPILPPDAPLFVRKLGAAEKKKKGKSCDVYVSNRETYASVNASSFSSRVCPKYTGAICGHAVTAHELRHSAAMFLLECGVSPQVIQQQLGHSSLIVTQRYLHSLQPSTIKAATQSAWDSVVC